MLSTGKPLRPVRFRGRTKFGDPAAVGDAVNIPGPGTYKNVMDPKYSPAPVPRLLGKPKERRVPRGADVPGPGSYRIEQAVGMQPQSTKRSAPSPSFGVGRRPLLARVDGEIDAAPGAYRIPDSMGAQFESTRPSGKSAVLRSRVPIRSKAHLSRIGPAKYAQKQALGKQFESKNRTAPSASFSGRTKFGSMYK